MAFDMNANISQDTNGAKSFKDAMFGLLQWSTAHHRAFKYDEIESIMSQPTWVDPRPIWDKWLFLPLLNAIVNA